MENKCDQQCRLFDFMANEIGIKVLHPGGYKSTKLLCSTMNIGMHSRVLDLACGAGTTSFFLDKKFGCKITGIDIDQNLLNIARNAISNKQKNIKFEYANALKLPFPENHFDIVISQAFFILIDEKEKALKEIARVLKPGGFFGSIELSWFDSPPADVFSDLVENACNDFIPRVRTFDSWQKVFTTNNFSLHNLSKYPMDSGILKMIRNEGFINFAKIMYKIMGDKSRKNRLMKVQNVFRKHKDYLGYGIYTLKNSNNRA